MRAQAELFYSTTGNNSYGTDFTTVAACTGTNVTNGSLFASGVANSLNTLLGGEVGKNSPMCVATTGGTAWAVSVNLPSDTTKTMCVDSTGVIKGNTTTSSVALVAGTCS